MGGSLRRLACAFMWLELGGGYLRAAFVEESLLALFAALDVAFPILNTFPIAYIASRRNADEVMKFGDRGELLPHVIFSLVTARDIHVLRLFRLSHITTRFPPLFLPVFKNCSSGSPACP